MSPSFRLPILFSLLYAVRPLAFEFQPLNNITAFAETPFGWIWNPTDPPVISVLLGDPNDDEGCPFLNDTNLDLEKLQIVVSQISLHTAQKQENGDLHGTDSVKVGKFGNKPPRAVKLCAYSYEITAKDKRINFNITFQNSTPQIPVMISPENHGNDRNRPRPGERPDSTATPGGSAGDSSASTKLSRGDIAGIIVGVIAFLAFLLLGLFLVYRRFRHRRRVEAFHRERMVLQQAQTQTFPVSSPATNQLSHIQKENFSPDLSKLFLTSPNEKEGLGQVSRPESLQGLKAQTDSIV